jgi:tetratricopeptide (TPR) repeat protein
MSGESQKLSKEELREDEFIEWLMHAVDYVRDNVQNFAIGAIAVVAVILAVNFFIESQEKSKVEAAALLGDVVMAEQSGQISEAIRIADQLLATYAGTPSAAQGTILLGNLHFSQGRYADAQRYFEMYLAEYEPVDVLINASQSGLAACLEAQGQVAAAAKSYEDIAQRLPGSAQAALAIMNAARCYKLMGDSDKQRILLKSVRDEYSRFPIAARARTELEML